MKSRFKSLFQAPAFFAGAFLSAGAFGGPVTSAWPVAGVDDCSSVAAASLSGWYAVADTFDNTVELRGVGANLLHTVPASDITALCPWMSFDAGEDGPTATALSDSGRLLYIAVWDNANAGDGMPSHAILRYDTQTGELRVFTRLTLPQPGIAHSKAALAHFKGRLYVSTPGRLDTYRATANDFSGPLLSTNNFSVSGAFGCGVAVDRVGNQIYCVTDNTLSRATLGPTNLSFSTVGSIASGIKSIAWSDHYGGLFNTGLYLAGWPGAGGPFTQLHFLTPLQARGTFTTAAAYMTGSTSFKSIAATADGKLLACADEDAVLISDSTDSDLGFSVWMTDEFQQVVSFARGLVTPCPTCCQNTPSCGVSCTPAGWVIDGDVQLGWTRFHPATPDAAAWTVLLLLMNDHIFADPTAQATVRLILERYAGRAPDGIGPSRTADGIFRHWINPCNGGQLGTWDAEHATLSTMKIVLAAARAKAFYPNDASIQASARAIICGVLNWDAYFRPGDYAIVFKGHLGGGPDLTSIGGGFNEGIIFAEQCAAYGGAYSDGVYARWIDRYAVCGGNPCWPLSISVVNQPLTGSVWSQAQAAFVSLYPMLTMQDFRASAGWRAQISALRISNAAWTDDNGPKHNTVFSAGTTPSGYNADSLTNHPSNLTTFPSLLAFCADAAASSNRAAEAVGAYQAYRVGARQTFLGGASILYRRSDADRAYQPNSAGLPDVVLGALGLAELIAPGSVGAVLTGPYPSCAACVADVDDGSGSGTPDGGVTIDDLLFYLAIFDAGLIAADVDDGTGTGTPDGGVTIDDLLYFLLRFDSGC